MRVMLALLIFTLFLAWTGFVAWWIVTESRMKKRLIQSIKERGHFRVEFPSGRAEWVPGTWPTPAGPPEVTLDAHGK